MARALFGLLVALGLTVPGFGKTIVVDLNGIGDYTEIQPAIDAAEDRDRVLVAAGEYEISETLQFNRPDSAGVKDIILVSERGPAETVIRVDPRDPFDAAVAFHSGETPASVLEGFTITGSSGVGVATMRSSPVILSCVITANRFHGVDADDGTALVSCEVIGNGGNGIRADAWSRIQVVGCIVSGNGRSGIFGDDGTWLTVTNCVVTGNGGAGILAGEDDESIAFVSFTTVSGNRYHGVQVEADTSFFMTSSIVFGNGGGPLLADSGLPVPEVIYSCIDWPGHGNIPADPLFVTPGIFDFDRTEGDGLPDFIVSPGDYRLRPESPCIDATDLSGALEDILGNPRPCGAQFDMGAYENDCPTTQPTFTRGDCNDDGNVDISDAVCILGWLFMSEGEPGCVAVTNTNADAEADLSDAVYLLGHLFLGGPAPSAPFPACGPMPEGEELACETQPASCQ